MIDEKKIVRIIRISLNCTWILADGFEYRIQHDKEGYTHNLDKAIKTCGDCGGKMTRKTEEVFIEVNSANSKEGEEIK